MRRRIKRIACAALLCALLCVLCFADADEELLSAEPVWDASTESEDAPAEESSAEPSSEASTEQDGGPETEQDTESETEQGAKPETEQGTESEPETEQGAKPETEQDTEPETEQDTEPETEQDTEPETEPSEEPPQEPECVLHISVVGGTQSEDGRWIVRYQTEQDPIEFLWDAVDGAALYRVRFVAGEAPILETETEAIPMTIAVSELLTAGAEENADLTLTVEAFREDQTSIISDKTVMVLTHDAQEERKWKSGGHGGFKGRSGSAPKEEDQGFHITPGTPLTGTHSKGDKSMRRYGSVEIAPTEAPVSAFQVDDASIVLDDGMFTASVESDALKLTPASDGRIWSFSGKALKTLNRSGINVLSLNSDGREIEIPTALQMQGTVYAKLSAQGIVSADYIFSVTADGTEVTAAGRRYRLTENRELVEIGG